MFIVPLSQLPSVAMGEQARLTGVAANTGAAGVPFADVLKSAIQDVKETQAVSEADAFKLATGQSDDLHTMQINSLKAASAVEFTVGLTSKMLAAYNEIIRMPV